MDRVAHTPPKGEGVIDFLISTIPENTKARLEFEMVSAYQGSLSNWNLLLNPFFAGALVLITRFYELERGDGILLAWFLAVCLIALGNARNFTSFRAAKTIPQGQVRHWCLTFAAGGLLSAIAWGAGGILLYNTQLDAAAQVSNSIVVLLLAGLAAGVTGSRVTLKWVMVGYVCLSMLPLAIYITADQLASINDTARVGEAVVRLATSPDTPPPLLLDVAQRAVPKWAYVQPLGEDLKHGPLVLALLMFIYAAYIIQSGLRSHVTVRDSIANRLEVERFSKIQGLLQDYFRALIENSSDLISVIDDQGILRFHSPASIKVLGFTPDEIVGHALVDYIHPDDVHQITAGVAQLRSDPNAVVGGVVRRRNKQGQWLLLEGEGRLLCGVEYNGAPLFVLNSRDVTERMAMEENLRRSRDAAEEALRAKDQFLASVSHEIRTPMNSILGLAEMLLDTPLNEKQRFYVETSFEAGGHLLGLLNDIIDFSRIRSGELRLERKVYSLDKLLHGVIALLRMQAEAKGLVLALTQPPDLPAWLKGDAQRLRQILVNLVRNAVKFTDRGHITLMVSIEKDVREQLHFTVRDTGIGIAPEQAKHVFEPFFQVQRNISKGDLGGSGLGLAIVSRLVEAMGGEIWFDSQLGKGTTFHFTVPVERASAPAVDVELSASGEVDPKSLPAARVLIADDVAMNRVVIKEFLSTTPCEVEFAHDGQETVLKATSQRYDLILMDIQMPLLDGRQATRAIRKHEAHVGAAPVPIIALTAGALDSDRESAQSAGCDDFLAKPVSRSQLFAMMHQYLTGH